MSILCSWRDVWTVVKTNNSDGCLKHGIGKWLIFHWSQCGCVDSSAINFSPRVFVCDKWCKADRMNRTGVWHGCICEAVWAHVCHVVRRLWRPQSTNENNSDISVHFFGIWLSLRLTENNVHTFGLKLPTSQKSQNECHCMETKAIKQQWHVILIYCVREISISYSRFNQPQYPP